LKNKARDIGFLLSTIPVYIGSSNNYTLHHIVSKVSPESEADKAGLKAMDLITHVNGEIIQVRTENRQNETIKIRAV
jgi:microtubule-associated serine/threonine kinase